MKNHNRVLISEMPKGTSDNWRCSKASKPSHFGAVLVLAIGLLLSSLNVSSAQEVPETNLSIPAGRLTTNIPESIIIPIQNARTQKGSDGWVLVYRNLVRSAQTPNTDLRFQSVKVPGTLRDGVIKWEILHTENEECLETVEVGCPDLIRILSVPEGYIAIPESAQVNERDGLRIFIVPLLIG